MTEKISEADARELIRVLHEDQGLRNPGFSREFAMRTITALNTWFEPGYHHTLWFERWEEARPIEEEVEEQVPPPKPVGFSDDDIPF